MVNITVISLNSAISHCMIFRPSEKTDRWTDGQINRQSDKQVDKSTEGYTDRQTDRQIDNQTEDRETDRQMERRTGSQQKDELTRYGQIVFFKKKTCV